MKFWHGGMVSSPHFVFTSLLRETSEIQRKREAVLVFEGLGEDSAQLDEIGRQAPLEVI